MIKKNNIEIQNIKKIIIIQTAFIGDVILVTPLISGLKKLFPDSFIDVMVIPQSSGILKNNPKVRAIVLFDKRNNKFKSFFNTIKTLRLNDYDIALSPHSSVTTAFLMYLSNIPIRVGFARWSAQFLLTHKLEHLTNTLKINKNLHLLSIFSDKKFPVQTELFPTDEMIENAKKYLSPLLTKVKKIIAVAPGSNWFTKRWPKEYYELLMKKLADLNYGIVLLGSSEEKELCFEINPNKNSINLAGKLSLLESAAVIQQCDLIVCNDSGALHLANAVKTDVIAFFGPTVKRIGYFPFREYDQVLEVDLECRPCSSHGTNSCPLGHHNCMHLIEPNLVIDKILMKFE